MLALSWKYLVWGSTGRENTWFGSHNPPDKSRIGCARILLDLPHSFNIFHSPSSGCCQEGTSAASFSEDICGM